METHLKIFRIGVDHKKNRCVHHRALPIPHKLKFHISEQIEKRGFFIGLPTSSLTKEKLTMLEKKLLNIEYLK